MKLIYNTKREELPLGSQNIYIAWHEDDSDALELLRSDLLECPRCANAAIWHDTEPEKSFSPDILYSKLQNMNIIVFAVTNKMLSENCRALERELTYTRSNSIALLPILIGDADPIEYDVRFPGVEAINRNDDDYREHLNGALDFLLGSSALAVEINRTVFRGRINVVSAPADFQYAFELAASIRSFDFCRDMSVTIDKSFPLHSSSDEKTKALVDLSDITVLCVSSNAMSPACSLQSVIYPHIVATGKPCLPVQVGEIKSERQLYSLFKHLDEPVPMSRKQLIHDRLFETMQFHFDNDNSPRRRYMTGMAYMNGIGYEIDRKLGHKLLVSAATDGCYDAQNELVRMYRTGIGIDFDLATAALWQSKVINYDAQIYNSDTSFENAERLAISLNLLGELYMSLEQYDKAENAYVNCSALCKRRLRGGTDERLSAQYTICCERLGDLKKRSFKFKSAEEHYRTALESTEALLQQEPTLSRMRIIANISEKLGDICMARGRISEAEVEYRRALDRRDFVASESKNKTYMRELAACYDKFAQLYLRSEENDRAEDACLQSCEIMRTLAKNFPTSHATLGLVRALGLRCSVLLETGNDDEALKSCTEAAELCGMIYNSLGTNALARELISYYDILCDISRRKDNNNDTIGYYEKKLKLLRILSDDNPTGVTPLEDIAEACLSVAELSASDEQGRIYLTEAARAYERLYELTGQRSHKNSAAAIHRRLNPRSIISERISIHPKKASFSTAEASDEESDGTA